MKPIRRLKCERGACDIHRGAQGPMQKRGASEAYKGVSGRKREAFRGASVRKKGTYEAHRAPQCERGASVMSIWAPARSYAKEGRL